MNRIYRTLLKNKVEQFIADFYSSSEVFKDLEKQNKLLHPGEFGALRERICDDLIAFSIPSKYTTGNGFLINSLDQISTQCDIVIYDFNNTPLIQGGSNNRFFPVESAVAIGEIKSSLDISSLCTAAVKLAHSKRIRQVHNVFCVNRPENQNFNPALNCYDTLFSFLICESINKFEYSKVFDALEVAYKKANIEQEYRHNVILSLKNGVLTYENQYSDLSPSIQEGQKMNIPTAALRNFQNSFLNASKADNVVYLVSSLSNFLMNVNVYYPEPNAYR